MLLDTDHPLTFEESKLRQIEAHALIYLSMQQRLRLSEKGLLLFHSNNSRPAEGNKDGKVRLTSLKAEK